jgi:uncharacterized metal-binding protein
MSVTDPGRTGKEKKMSECGCSCGENVNEKDVLLYACSGGANVGEVADRAARELMAEGAGTMWCLAGLGAGVEPIVRRAKEADVNLVLDGCGVDCAKKVFERAGMTNFTQIKVTDLGIEKVKGVRATDEQVSKLMAKAREALRQAQGETT